MSEELEQPKERKFEQYNRDWIKTVGKCCVCHADCIVPFSELGLQFIICEECAERERRQGQKP